MDDFFTKESAARQALEAEREAILDKHRKAVADADAARDAAISVAQEKFDKEQLRLVKDHADARQKELDAQIEASNAAVGLDKDGNPPKAVKAKKAEV